MSRYVEVFWTPWAKAPTNPPFAAARVLIQPPEPAFTAISKARPNTQYIKCPAFANTCKNSFVVRSPVDLKIIIDHEKQAVFTDRYGQDFFDTEIEPRPHQMHPDNPFLISLMPKILFYSKESVEIEMLDLFVLQSPAHVKTIPGKFNIGKWPRPIEWAIEVDKAVSEVPLKAGDPLYIVRFITKNNVPIKLTRVSQTQEIITFCTALHDVKNYARNLSLKKLYELAANYVDMFKRNHK